MFMNEIKDNILWFQLNCDLLLCNINALKKKFRRHLQYFIPYTPYIPWEIWLAKSHFHEYAWGREDQSSSNEIACYNKILLISMTSYRDFLIKNRNVVKYGWDKAHVQLPGWLSW